MRSILKHLLLLFAVCAIKAQTVYNVLMPIPDVNYSFHGIFDVGEHYIVLAERLSGWGDSLFSEIITLNVSEDGQVLAENVIESHLGVRYGVEVTGHTAVRINDKIYFVFNREYGLFTGHNHPQLFVIDINGNLLFSKELVINDNIEDLIYGINKTATGELVLVGERNYTYSDRPILMIKSDTLGNVLWEKEIYYQGQYKGTGFSVAQLANGDFIISGSVYAGVSPGVYFQMYYARTDSVGNVIWEYDLGVNNALDIHLSCFIDSDSTIILYGGYGLEPSIHRINMDGDILDSEIISIGEQSSMRLIVKVDSLYILHYYQYGGILRNYLIAYDYNFNEVFSTDLVYNENAALQIQDMKLGSDCSLIMCGYLYASSGLQGFLYKTSLEGESCGEPNCYDEYINEYADCMDTGISINDPPSMVKELNISISPNPGKGFYLLEWEKQADEMEPFSLYLTDINGKIVKETSQYRGASYLLDISNLPTGTYVVRIITPKSALSGQIIHLSPSR